MFTSYSISIKTVYESKHPENLCSPDYLPKRSHCNLLPLLLIGI